MELKEGIDIYYIEDHQLYQGHLIDLEKISNGYLFSIDTYGHCEGHYRISSDQIGYQFFLTEQEAIKKM